MGAEPRLSRSLVNRIYAPLANEIPFSPPIPSMRTNELELVRGVLRMLQGFSGTLFSWDHSGNCFHVKNGVYLTHVSLKSLHSLLNQFIYAASCLQLVQITVNKIETAIPKPPPTFKAFATSASEWLKRLRDIALKEEVSMNNAEGISTPTLLGLANSLSSLCSGAEFLLQTLHEAIPEVYFEFASSVPAADLAVHILDYLHKKLDEMCLVQGGEEEAYQMVLYMYVGSLLPYIEGLDSWLFEGILEDPFDEMFFFANKEVSVDEVEFWEKSYLLRKLQPSKLDPDFSSTNYVGNFVSASNDKKEMGSRDSISLSSTIKGKEQRVRDCPACPLFIKDLARSIVSAGKSLQLMRHVPTSLAVYSKGSNCNIGSPKYLNYLSPSHRMAGLTLSEIFSVSLAGLIGHGDHVCKYFWQDDWCESVLVSSFVSHVNKEKTNIDNNENLTAPPYSDKIWYNFLIDTVFQKKSSDLKPNFEDINNGSVDLKGARVVEDEFPLFRSCLENPVITVCRTNIGKHGDALKTLNVSRNFCLPSLNDESLRTAIFGGENTTFSGSEGTNYTFGFQFGESEYIHSQDEKKLLEMLFPFPTILPSFQDDLPVSELLPFQRNSTLPSRVLHWMQNVDLRTTPLPLVIMQYCLTAYIQKQVDYIGVNMLLKLMNEWRLMEELAVLRAIYLLGSGDLLQHFLTVIFTKLNEGETWDDDFELNTILQESIRNSADCMLLSAPDSLVVSITKNLVDGDEEASIAGTVPGTPRKSYCHVNNFGINGLDMLKFTYKVPWPLELIANAEAIKKYNQVMRFLLKVKRAKFVLDKVRRWMWKGRGSTTNNRKHHWLVEQKLLHFVDAFHQYVMDRVYHSAWRELCEGMTVAKSLDEVIEAHETYILSIQRQCFVVPDKLGALIASRINIILGLALDFYTIQQTLGSGGAVSAIKARCEMEVDRIEKQFDDCIAFLLRVLSFKLNVGHFPHLADLVTRINYNYFYMSANGNLMSASSSGSVTSRLGKPSA